MTTEPNRRRHPGNNFRVPLSQRTEWVVPGSLLALTGEDWTARNLYEAVRYFSGPIAHASATHHHPILFRGKWAMPLDSAGYPALSETNRDARYLPLVESMQLLGYEVQACERHPERPWPRYPIAIYDDTGLVTHTEDLLNLDDGRAFYEAWSHEELREHALRHDFTNMYASMIAKAKELTTQANALVAAGESDAVPVAEYRRLTDWAYSECTNERALARLHSDPNLLKSIPPVRSTSLASRSIGRQAARDWAVVITLTSDVPCTLSVRNVTVNLLEQTLHTDTTGPVWVGANPRGRNVILRVKVTSELYGNFIAHIDATPSGQRDPAATIAVTLNEPEPAPEPEEEDSGNGEEASE